MACNLDEINRVHIIFYSILSRWENIVSQRELWGLGCQSEKYFRSYLWEIQILSILVAFKGGGKQCIPISLEEFVNWMHAPALGVLSSPSHIAGITSPHAGLYFLTSLWVNEAMWLILVNEPKSKSDVSAFLSQSIYLSVQGLLAVYLSSTTGDIQDGGCPVSLGSWVTIICKAFSPVPNGYITWARNKPLY